MSGPTPDGQWRVHRLSSASVMALSSVSAVAALALLPLVLGPYPVIVLTSALALSIACLAMNLLLGSTGLLSFGHGTFLGIGAYTGGMLFTFGYTTSFEVYLGSGVLVVTALATVFGFLWAATTGITSASSPWPSVRSSTRSS